MDAHARANFCLYECPGFGEKLRAIGRNAAARVVGVPGPAATSYESLDVEYRTRPVESRSEALTLHARTCAVARAGLSLAKFSAVNGGISCLEQPSRILI